MITRRSFLALPIGSALVRLGASTWPVLVPDRPWEGACAMPYSGGLVRDERGHLRLYYLSNFRDLAVAVSTNDGLTWRKPELFDGTNIVLRPIGPVDAISVCRHGSEGRYCAIVTSPGLGRVRFYSSPDGLVWGGHTVEHQGGDRTSLAYFRGRFLFFVRTGGGTGGDPRRFDLVESETFPPTGWEPRRDWLRVPDDADQSQLYGVDLIGGPHGNALALTLWQPAEPGRPKLNHVRLGLLRDDLTVLRDVAPVAVPGLPGAWNYGNVQGVCGGAFQTAAGRWRMLVSGRAGDGLGGNGICSTGVVDL